MAVTGCGEVRGTRSGKSTIQSDDACPHVHISQTSSGRRAAKRSPSVHKMDEGHDQRGRGVDGFETKRTRAAIIKADEAEADSRGHER